MAVATKAIGKTTTCMVTAFTLGRTEESMTVNISRTESMDLESILGPMVVSTKVSGRTDANTEKAPIGLIRAQNHAVVNG